ncbi:hypothetical protein [Bosea sp. (in: a-proteobacteria)]|jgi:hypothetical protein|uniref:hypothetical protein n=1 Tax=Bosea sp. (in: a-proteobacteria) TaxID=1871050 RepID=UPI003F719875
MASTDYRIVLAHLTAAFLAIEGDAPGDGLFRRAVELLIQAVAEAERDNVQSQILRFPDRLPAKPDEPLPAWRR